MRPNPSFWRTWPGFCAMLLIAALLFFLLAEHTAHFLGALPFAIFLLCPLLHIFMHKGHGAHGSRDESTAADVKLTSSGEEHHT